MNYERHSHSFGLSCHHLQFTPKYRRKVFEEKTIRRFCEGFCHVIAKELGVRLVAVNFGTDHMHIFVANCKHYSDTQLAHAFKGRLSYEIRRRFSDLLARHKLGDSFWSNGYFYETCGNVTASAREYYIKRMQNKHWPVADHRSSQAQLTNFTRYGKPSGL
jgi:putative transposase